MSGKIDTRKTRHKIGFPTELKQWALAPANFSKHALRINGHPVMEDWESGYMQKLAAIASHSGGRVLEVGYGMGLSARAIQSHKPEAHWVIECNDDVIKKAEDDFAKELSNGRMRLLPGFWEDVTPTLPDASFDGILFDTYPLNAEQIHSNHFWFFEEAYRLLKPGGTLTYYSDEIKEFSPSHLAKLTEAGFQPANINSEICNVSPPPDCEYWQANTILAPIVRKPL